VLINVPVAHVANTLLSPLINDTGIGFQLNYGGTIVLFLFFQFVGLLSVTVSTMQTMWLWLLQQKVRFVDWCDDKLLLILSLIFSVYHLPFA